MSAFLKTANILALVRCCRGDDESRLRCSPCPRSATKPTFLLHARQAMSRRRAVTNHLTNNDPIKRSERAHVTAAPTALQNTSESRNVQPRSFNEDALGSHATHLVFDPEQASISWSLIINVTCHKKETQPKRAAPTKTLQQKQAANLALKHLRFNLQQLHQCNAL